MRKLRKLMHILSSYIDDIYLQGDSELECIQNFADTIILLHELGFTLHPDKCELIPSTKVKTLGIIINSVTLTQDKTENILSLLKQNIRRNVIKIRELARIIGKLVAAFPLSLYLLETQKRTKQLHSKRQTVIMRLIQHCLIHPSKKCNGGWKIYHICLMSSIIRPLQYASIVMHQI